LKPESSSPFSQIGVDNIITRMKSLAVNYQFEKEVVPPSGQSMDVNSLKITNQTPKEN
jgi:hypothetical protein